MLTMKKALSICLIIAGLSLYAVNFGLAETHYIVREGKPSAVVILPNHASDAEIFAAQELIGYISKMSHAVLPQRQESSRHSNSQVKIFLGRTAEARRHELAFAKSVTPGDAFKIVTKGTDLFIFGKGDRGTLYGVYEFLERHGVRWLMPGDMGEIVPAKTTIALQQYKIAQEPAFLYRRFIQLATPKDLRGLNYQWQLRMRLNCSFPKSYQKKMGGTIGDGPLSHNYRRLIDKGSYNRHPEYFAMVNGRRIDPRRKKQYWKMCLSNETVIRTAQKKTLSYLRDHPDIDFFSLSPNDGKNWCECENCRMLQDNKTDQSGPVFHFAKRIIEAVGPKYPDIGFPVLSYGKYRLPPEGYHAPKGLMVNIAIGGDFSKPITAPENAKSRRPFEAWKKHGFPSWVYLYTAKMAFRQLPWPLFRNTVENIRYSYEMGAVGVYGQGSGSNWGPNGLQYYMTAKALWNPQMNVDAVLDDYCRAGFGPAAEAIKGYYETYWQAVESKGVPLKRMTGANGSSIYKRAIDIYSPDVLRKARKYIEQAYKLAENRQDIRKRIDLLEVTQSYTEKFIPFAAADRMWRKNRRKKDVALRRLKLAKEIIAYLDETKEKEPMAIVYSEKNPFSAYSLPRRALRWRLLPDRIEQKITQK